MKGKVLNLLTILTSLIGFLQWGKGNAMFLFEVEADILAKLIEHPTEVIHPLIILPLLGQLMLVVTLLQRKPSRVLTWMGVVALAILLGFLFLIGVLDLHAKILASTLPFLVVVFFQVNHLRSTSLNKPTSSN